MFTKSDGMFAEHKRAMVAVGEEPSCAVVAAERSVVCHAAPCGLAVAADSTRRMCHPCQRAGRVLLRL